MGAKKIIIFIIALFMLIISVESAFSSVDDAVAYYSHNTSDIDGATTIDITGKNPTQYNGTRTGTNIVAGRLAEALQFNGSNVGAKLEYINLNFNSYTDNYAISLWARPAIDQDGEKIWGENANWQGIAIGNLANFCDNDKICFAINDGGWKQAKSTTTFNPGSWYHIVASKNTTGIALWINGSLEAYTATGNVGGVGTQYIASRNGAEEWFNGTIDEVGIYNHNLTQLDVNELYNGGTGYNPYEPSSAPPSPLINITEILSVQDNESFNTASFPINFNLLANSTWEYNCSIFHNGSGTMEINESAVHFQTGKNTNVSINVTFPDGHYEVLISCYNTSNLSLQQTNTSSIAVFIDTISPSVWSNITNETIFYGQNVSLQANFTDTDNVYSYNISLNGVQLWHQKGINRSEYSFNFSLGLNESPAGTYIIVIDAFDGHTREYIDEFDKVTNGLFNNYLKFEDNNKEILIQAKDNSIFDSWSYKKEIDRYTFDYNPSSVKDTYTFTVETDDKLTIINNQNTKWKTWLIAGDKWIDFFIDETTIPSIRKITDYKAEVTITPKNKELLQFTSVGELNKASINYTIYNIKTNVTYPLIAMENSLTSIVLNVSYPSEVTIAAKLIYNNTNYTATRVNFAGYSLFTATPMTPNVDQNLNVTFDWEIIANSIVFNTSYYNQTILNTSMKMCGAGDDILLNMTARDENLQTVIPPPTDIRLDITITDDFTGTQYNYSNSTNQTYISVCLPAGTLDSMTASTSRYYADIVVSYTADNYSQEFWYMDNGTVDNSSFFNPYTRTNISLYDLPLVDSTSFLFAFTDEFGLPVEDSIIHTYRRYIGDGIFREVERSREDDNGETHIHLIEEDAIYYFMITKYGHIIYTSSTYNAKCLSTPCSIELSAAPAFTIYDWNPEDGIDFTWFLNSTSREVRLDFVSNASDLINLTLYQYQNNDDSLINETSLNATSGTLSLTIPLSYGNTTFFVAVHRNNNFVLSRWVDFRMSGRDYFGATGAVLGGLMVALIALMTLSEGIVLIIAVVLTLFLLGVMMLIDLSWLTVISIACAGGIIIYKIIKLKRDA